MNTYFMENSYSTPPCSCCKKPSTICYTSVDSDLITRSYLCSACPSFQSERYGKDISDINLSQSSILNVECGNCKMSWKQVEADEILGCSQCYVVFKDLLITRLSKANKISSCFASDKHSGILHIGKKPEEIREINPTLQVIALKEALKETLDKEEYEQAAFIRDQIKKLQDNAPNTENHE